MKRERKEDDSTKFVLGEFLGRGAYNSVYALSNIDGVLRIGMLPFDEPETKQTVIRGLEMIHIFKQFSSRLGPSLLREISPYRIIYQSEIPQYIKGNLSLSADPLKLNQVALQHIERLGGGDLNAPNMNLKQEEQVFCVFCLLWFFASAQQLFGYRHRDLKGPNIVLRHIPDSKERTVFKISDGNNVYHYHYDYKVAPVVIDYDFASVYTTKEYSDRDMVGTDYTVPPDVIVERIADLADYVEDGDWRIYNPHVYDYWSLGICILELLWKEEKRLDELFRLEASLFAQHITKTPTFELSEIEPTFLDSLFMGVCFASVVAGTSMIPPKEFYGFLSDLTIEGENLWGLWDDIMLKSDDYRMLVRFFNNLDTGLKSILRQLLNWNPAVRNANNKPMELILKSRYFDLFKPKTSLNSIDLKDALIYEGTNIEIDVDEKLIEEDQQRLKQYHLLENKVCGGCGIEPHKKEVMYLCSCCAGVFCGEECQRIKH